MGNYNFLLKYKPIITTINIFFLSAGYYTRFTWIKGAWSEVKMFVVSTNRSIALANDCRGNNGYMDILRYLKYCKKNNKSVPFSKR